MTNIDYHLKLELNIIHIDPDTAICHKIQQIFQNSEKVTVQEANAETAHLELKIRFKCFCFSLSSITILKAEGKSLAYKWQSR